MKKRLIHLLLGVLCAAPIRAQDSLFISGHVLGPKAEPVPFASISLEGRGTTADPDGHFRIAGPTQWPAYLITSASGYSTDSTHLYRRITEVTVRLEPVTELGAAEVVERKSGNEMSLRNTFSNERITSKELKRAACCDLSESFETNATVDVSYADAISGTKTIRMLGLDGRYAQISLENIPFIRGLSSSYGLTLIPGPWIQAINVSKGIGTAVNGPNAMTGQIDLCLVDPGDAPPLFTNLFVNNQGRTELNVNTAQHLGKIGDNLLMIQGSTNQRDMDDNKDGFRDMPLSQRFNVMDRWMQRKGRRITQVIARYVADSRNAGHTSAHVPGEGPSGKHYTVDITNEMGDLIVKNGWMMRDSTKSIGVLGSFRNHTVNSSFGDRRYEGAQLSAYGNLVYQQLLRKGNDQLKTGMSFQYDAVDQRFLDSSFSRVERMPGAFAEYTRKRKNLTIVGGLRADLNSWGGNVVSPRAHVKYDLGPLTALRASVGHAFRTADPLVENAAVLASSRKVTVEGALGQERAWNSGLSLLHKWKWFGRKWALAFDLYRTDFSAQVIADMDRSPQQLVIYMLKGTSHANSALLDVDVELSRTLRAKASYRWYDVRSTYDGILRERPFTPTHRGLVDLAYESRNDKWRFDAHTNIFGSARISSTASNPEDLRMPDRSPVYATLNAQVTHVLGTLELYLGCENLTGYTQSRQVLAPQDPFGPYFDASLIWGPTNGAMIYGGFRHTIKRKQTDKKP